MTEDNMKLNWDEVLAWAALVAAFHARTGHDPNDKEWREMVITARELAVAPSAWLH